MAYTRKTWVNVPDPDSYNGDIPLSDLPRYDADNMNRIEDGVEKAANTILLDGEDILSISETGRYYTRNCVNTPVQANGYMSVINYDDSYRTVEWTRNGVRAKYLNILKDGEWLGWVELLHTANSVHWLQDAVENNNLHVKSIAGGIEVTENSNLNSYIAIGNYICSMSAVAQTLINCPITRAFVMTVGYAHGGSAYISQEITQFDTGVKYYRFYNATSKEWSSWQSTYGTANNPIVRGRYSGNGEESQFIDLGFTPATVEIYKADGVQVRSYSETDTVRYYGGFAMGGNPCQINTKSGIEPVVTIVTNGFKVFYKKHENNKGDGMWVESNGNGSTYYFIATRHTEEA